MTAQEQLQSIHLLNRELSCLLRAQAKARQRYSRLQANRPNLAKQALKQCQALSQAILSLYVCLDTRRQELCQLIDRLPRPDERQVLKLTYLSGFTMEETAEMLHFSVRHTYRLKQRALERLQALLMRPGAPENAAPAP